MDLKKTKEVTRDRRNRQNKEFYICIIHQNDYSNDEEMHECITHGIYEKSIRKYKGKRPTGKPTHGRKDNIKTYLESLIM
jgi:hypothetical protein